MQSLVPQIKKILFTTDLSMQARHAFAYGVGIAHKFGADLTILYVMEDVAGSTSQNSNLQAFIGQNRWEELRQTREQEVRQVLIGKRRESVMIREALGEMVSATQQDLPEARPPEEIVVTQGEAAECIVHEAETRGIDLIVMGYTPRGRLEEAISGSVSRSVLRRTHIPVLMVRLPETSA
jgi:nucleotide-binding universal stress UspA family protein